MLQNVGRVPTIINYTIAVADTWEQVHTAKPGSRKWFIKARNSTDNAFDIAFEDSPSTHITTDGTGINSDFCEAPDIYVRSPTVGTILEILIWN